MYKLRHIVCFLFLLTGLSASATHIVGGEMNYRHLGGNVYEIRLTVYRDCINGVPPFDNPASIGIYNASNLLVNLSYNYTGYYPGNSLNYYNNATFNNQTYGYLIHPNDSQHVPNIINDPCVIPPTNVCYSVCHYIDTVYLPPIPGGYHLVYQRCCRNFSIANIVGPLNVGATYDAWIPPLPYSDDSNPRFNAWPPTYICVNQPFTFNHSATDYDGDSLVYQLCDPLDGASAPNPMPQPPFAPPYNTVTWQPPYSIANVFGGVPLSIDPQTGWLTATPNSTGQFVYAVCVTEYRNGVPIGQTRRDFQVNIVNCSNITVSSILSPSLACGNNNASFTNNSTGAATYLWNFGDTSTLGDTSNLFQPSYSYPDTGWYNVMLIAFSSINPACDDTSYANVHVNPPLAASFTFQVLPCSRTVVFTDSASTLSGSPNSWYWNFGDGDTSSQHNPTHTYPANGNYQVTLIMQTNTGCADTVVIQVPVNYQPVASAFAYANVTCTNAFNFTNQSANAISYSWNFGDASSSTLANPSHTYASTGNYTVTLIASDSSGCSDTVSQVVAIPVPPQASFNYQVDTCSLTVTFTNSSGNASSYSWDFGDASASTQTNPVHTYGAPGNYNVILIATSAAGCDDTLTVPVPLVINLPVAAFTVTPSPCTFNISISNQSAGANNYSWNFGDNTTSGLQNPSHSYSQPGNYTITLIASGVATCADTVTQNVIIDPLPAASFTQVLDTCALNAVFNNTSVNGSSYLWDFGDASTSTQINPAHTYSAAGNYTVTLTATDVNGCTATASGSFMFAPLPTAAFIANPVPCTYNVSINNQSVNAFGYAWDFGDSATSTQTNPVHAYAQPGNYTITLIVYSLTSCTDTITQNITVNPLPAASFIEALDTCALNAVFTNTSVNSSVYSWNFGDASASNQANPSHSYSVAGNYTVILTVTDVNGCTSTAIHSFTFPPLPVASFTHQPDLCSRLISFTNNSVNAASYLWDFGDASTSTAQNPSHLYSSNGNYNVTLITTSASGCSDTLTAPVNVNYFPVTAAFNYVNTVCSYYVSFTNQTTGGTSYYWNFGDSYFSSQVNPNHTYSAPGNYTITLVATDANGCNDTISQNITLPVPSQASFTFVPDSCTRLVTFTNNSYNANSYYWDFGDAANSFQANPSHTYAANGNYNVTLLATSPAGCTDTIVIPVPVNITLPIAAFTPAANICSFNVNLTNQSLNASSYAWNFGDNTTSNLANPTHSYQNPGNYLITLHVTTPAGCVDSIANNVGIAPVPVASFTPQIDTCSLVAQFFNTSQNAVSYFWNFGDSTTSVSVNPGLHAYPGTGSYNVMLVVEDVNGCRDTLVRTVNPYIASHADYSFSIDSCAQEVNFFNHSDLAFSYLWNFGDGQTSTEFSGNHHYLNDGNYPVLLITNPGTVCADTASYTVDFSLLTAGNIYIPNAFTPNSDGKNDIFEVVGYYPCDDLTLYIFNRWGELIYKTSGPHIIWDGNYVDHSVKLEVFVYILEGKYFYQNGTITVIR